MTSEYAKFISDVGSNLSAKCDKRLAVYALEGEPGPHRVAFAIVEIVESAEKLIALATKLRRPDEMSEELLSDFRDEIEHLLYHVRDSGEFSDLLAQAQDEEG
jgi:hypothetical protein